MKKYLLLISSVLLLFACGNQPQQTKEENADVAEQKVEPKDVKSMNFDELFVKISPEEMTDNVFNLVGKDFTVITAGDESHYNSMTASWGGVGILFSKPVTWCFLRSNRYTLEVMKNKETYTMSYFPEEYKDQVMLFGSKSGRDTDKMKETTLTTVVTPNGNMSYKEAKLIIECKMTELTTVSPGDFYTQEGKDFITEAHKETNDYHKLVFGDIVNIWIKK